MGQKQTGSEAAGMTDDLITRREAAKLAGVHINTIRLWESTGRISVQKAENGVVLIPRSQIDTIVADRRDGDLDASARAAALEAENKVLREELQLTRERYEKLLDRVIHMAGGGDES